MPRRGQCRARRDFLHFRERGPLSAGLGKGEFVHSVRERAAKSPQRRSRIPTRSSTPAGIDEVLAMGLGESADAATPVPRTRFYIGLLQTNLLEPEVMSTMVETALLSRIKSPAGEPIVERFICKAHDAFQLPLTMRCRSCIRQCPGELSVSMHVATPIFMTSATSRPPLRETPQRVCAYCGRCLNPCWASLRLRIGIVAVP